MTKLVKAMCVGREESQRGIIQEVRGGQEGREKGTKRFLAVW